MQFLGRQILVEFHECSPELLGDAARLRSILREAVRRSGATILHETAHEFSPQGVSVVVVLAESHAALHTWPEHGYASLDVFTCGDRVDPWLIQQYVQERLRAGQVFSAELKRGLISATHPERASAFAPAFSESQPGRGA